jgi:hypothetical protein
VPKVTVRDLVDLTSWIVILNVTLAVQVYYQDASCQHPSYIKYDFATPSAFVGSDPCEKLISYLPVCCDGEVEESLYGSLRVYYSNSTDTYAHHFAKLGTTHVLVQAGPDSGIVFPIDTCYKMGANNKPTYKARCSVPGVPVMEYCPTDGNSYTWSTNPAPWTWQLLCPVPVYHCLSTGSCISAVRSISPNGEIVSFQTLYESITMSTIQPLQCGSNVSSKRSAKVVSAVLLGIVVGWAAENFVDGQTGSLARIVCEVYNNKVGTMNSEFSQIGGQSVQTIVPVSCPPKSQQSQRSVASSADFLLTSSLNVTTFTLTNSSVTLVLSWYDETWATMTLEFDMPFKDEILNGTELLSYTLNVTSTISETVEASPESPPSVFMSTNPSSQLGEPFLDSTTPVSSETTTKLPTSEATFAEKAGIVSILCILSLLLCI